MKWFGVKSAYLYEVKGRPVKKDKDYSSKKLLLEERVIIVQAKDEDAALRTGEKEARQYTTGAIYTNPYGQKVTIKYLKIMEVFELYDSPQDLCEVFSATRIIDEKDKSFKAIRDIVLGKDERKLSKKVRRKFLNADFN